MAQVEVTVGMDATDDSAAARSLRAMWKAAVRNAGGRPVGGPEGWEELAPDDGQRRFRVWGEAVPDR